jgi:hypothetical protein
MSKQGIELGWESRKVLMAYVLAAAEGMINDYQDMGVHFDVLVTLTGNSKHSVAGAIGHLMEHEILAADTGSQSSHPGRHWEEWYYLLVKGGEWLVNESGMPKNVVSLFFNPAAGWDFQQIAHFAEFVSDCDVQIEGLKAWIKGVPEIVEMAVSERMDAARKIHADAEAELYSHAGSVRW